MILPALIIFSLVGFNVFVTYHIAQTPYPFEISTALIACGILLVAQFTLSEMNYRKLLKVEK